MEPQKRITFAAQKGNKETPSKKFLDIMQQQITCGSSSVGRAQPCQGWGRESESRLPLEWFARMAELVDAQDLKSCCQEWQYRFDAGSGYEKDILA